MRKRYFAVVAFSVCAHFAYLAYVPIGGFLALRWRRTTWLHVASVCWGVLVVALPVPCPLTTLEDWARARAGLAPLPATGFIDRYVAGVLYPAGRTGLAQAFAFGAALASWVALARTRKSFRHSRSEALPGPRALPDAQRVLLR
ncbi:DUF2784 domain-containing protein [Mycobacterium conspicuum]|jgi:hypothetical protein|uniref:Uncharacterized protein n=1 Tax=Mycobacterium conspicuum TaxID=44010 RepID=A0A1X1TGS1_9MYCO|nr:DUF2784 domain-containing protein [Mycobacterium conspicuum]ORV43762.1 hypothetical protein AWC00_08595 [Mycobacterium conspicuum]BBZ38346.1 hypothetical protein MCNS_14090 [Mycobacterium conspicuum]